MGANVVSKATWAMGVAMMKTTTAVAIGTMAIAVARTTTNTNTITAQHASVWIQRNIQMRQNAMDTAEVQTSKVTAIAMTATTTAVVTTTVVTVVETKEANGNTRIAQIANARTQLKRVQTRATTIILDIREVNVSDIDFFGFR